MNPLYELEVGPAFARGLTRLGRERLDAGTVAILDDVARLNAALRELVMYTDRSDGSQTRRAIVHRRVSAGEAQARLHRLFELLGPDQFNRSCELFHCPENHLHLIDSFALRHILSRHGGSSLHNPSELPLNMDDIALIPELINPRNLVRCDNTNNCARLIYEKDFEGGRMVAVSEIRRRHVALVTCFKNKKGRGGPLAGE